jgi:zinc protease
MTPALLLAALAHAADPAPMALPTDVVVLDNGLTVLLHQDDRTDRAALFIRFDVGSRDEADGEHGCAHLFEHLMFEGSASVPNNAFDTWLTEAGGENNAYTSPDETAYHMVFPSGALDLALFLESDRLGFLDAGLDAANLANQQKVVLQEREQGYAQPNGRDWDALTRLTYPAGHPYHVPVIGTVADIEGFTLEAVQSFWQRHYRPRNAVLTLVTPLPTSEALEAVVRWFGPLGDTGAPAARPEASPAPAGATPGRGMLEDAVEERTLYLLYPTVPAGHPDEPALDLLAGVLSDGRGTRIDDALYYAKPLTTDAGAGHWTSDLSGEFLIYGTSPDLPLRKLEARIDKVLDQLARKPPTAEELERARTGVLHGMLDSTESALGRAQLLMACYDLHGDPDCLATEFARYQAVTPADLARVAATWLRPDARVSLSVVPAGDDGALSDATPVELP